MKDSFGGVIMDDRLIVNEGKNEFVTYRGQVFGCYAIRTATITSDYSLEDVLTTFAVPVVEPGDVVFISEKMAACTEGRAIPIDKIKPGFFARLLSKFVTKSSRGIGLAIPETMQCAIDEVGLFRILIASFAGFIGKIYGKKGWFYIIAGYKAASIDGPCSYTIPPYNRCVVLSPLEPDGCAMKASLLLGGNTVLIIDANDFGVNILGSSVKSFDREMYESLLRQNPLGQSRQSTPIGILRQV